MSVRTAKPAMTFTQWMREVDAALALRAGLVSADLPDVCYADWFEQGVRPKSAAARAIKAAQGEDECF